MTHAERLREEAQKIDDYSNDNSDLPDFFYALLAGAEALEREKWIPIEQYDEAKHGIRALLLFSNGDQHVCAWHAIPQWVDGGLWRITAPHARCLKHQPTHFMPLPAPPTKGV